MQRTLLLAAVAALALAAAPAAAAKEITKAEVCGPDGCTNVGDRAALPILANGGPAAHAADRRALLRRPRHDGGGRPGRDVELRRRARARHAMRADDGTWMRDGARHRRR